MTILQINSVCGRGSTGRIALDIAKAAESKGDTCYIAYGHGNTDYAHSYRIGGDFDHLFHNAIYSRVLGLQGYGSKSATRKFLRWVDTINPNVIHLHNLHANYLNFELLFEYIIDKKIPVVWTLHDCLNFTGKCTSFTSAYCFKWKTGCANCPLYKSSGVPSLWFDRSKKIFNDKIRLYNRVGQMRVIAVSKWLANEARQSILNRNQGHRIGYIYNWIDYTTFHPARDDEKVAFRLNNNLASEYKYLISVSQEWVKGSIRLEDALSLNERIPDNYKLILVGKLGTGVQLPDSIIHIPYISSQSELAKAYSISEAYVHFSVQDTFGLVIGEAMACGTIPITYNSTACAETPGGYGIVVPPRDIDAIIQALPGLELKQRLISEMIDYVKSNYDKSSNITQYLSLYNEVCSL